MTGVDNVFVVHFCVFLNNSEIPSLYGNFIERNPATLGEAQMEFAILSQLDSTTRCKISRINVEIISDPNTITSATLPFMYIGDESTDNQVVLKTYYEYAPATCDQTLDFCPGCGYDLTLAQKNLICDHPEGCGRIKAQERLANNNDVESEGGFFT